MNARRTVLAIDSSRRGASLALARTGEPSLVREHDPKLGFAEELFGLLDRLLDDAGCSVESLTSIAVVSGPGSYTGLRIGAMTAKALAWARGWDLHAGGSLPILAAAADPEQSVATFTVAGRQAAFGWIAGPVGKGGRRPDLRTPARVAEGELEEFISALPRECPVVLGRDLPVVWAAGRDLIRREELASPLAEAALKDAPWVELVRPVDLQPDYLLPSQAERMHGVDLREELRRPTPPGYRPA